MYTCTYISLQGDARRIFRSCGPTKPQTYTRSASWNFQQPSRLRLPRRSPRKRPKIVMKAVLLRTRSWEASGTPKVSKNDPKMVEFDPNFFGFFPQNSLGTSLVFAWLLQGSCLAIACYLLGNCFENAPYFVGILLGNFLAFSW